MWVGVGERRWLVRKRKGRKGVPEQVEHSSCRPWTVKVTGFQFLTLANIEIAIVLFDQRASGSHCRGENHRAAAESWMHSRSWSNEALWPSSHCDQLQSSLAPPLWSVFSFFFLFVLYCLCRFELKSTRCELQFWVCLFKMLQVDIWRLIVVGAVLCLGIGISWFRRSQPGRGGRALLEQQQN